jgi:hypothetical protein
MAKGGEATRKQIKTVPRIRLRDRSANIQRGNPLGIGLQNPQLCLGVPGYPFRTIFQFTYPKVQK